MTETAKAKAKVLAVFPDAKECKLNIASWAICVGPDQFWLSYGQPRAREAWIKAAKDLHEKR